MPRLNGYGEIARNYQGAALGACWLTAETALFQQPLRIVDDTWCLATRARGATGYGTPRTDMAGGANALAAGGGVFLRRLDGAAAPLWGTVRGTYPADGYVGDVDRDGRWVAVSANGLTLYDDSGTLTRPEVQGGTRLMDGLLCWTAAGRVVVRDWLGAVLTVAQVGPGAAWALAFERHGEPWICYQTDEHGGVIHPAKDARVGYRYGTPRSIYDPDVLVDAQTGALTVTWAVDEGQVDCRTLRIDADAVLVPLTPLVTPPAPTPTPTPALDTFGVRSGRIADDVSLFLPNFVFGAWDMWPRTGTHPMCQAYLGGDQHAFVKFGRPANYELWAEGLQFIHHLEDASGNGETYRFTDTRWLPTTMRPSDVFVTGEHEAVYYDKATKRELRRAPFHRRAWIVEAWERFDCGPDLGVRRVAVIAYDPTAGFHSADRGIELFYFAEGAGWVRWEYHRSDRVFSSGVATFSAASRVAVSDFYRFGGTRQAPRLTGCAAPWAGDGAQTTPPPVAPPTPVPSPAPLPGQPDTFTADQALTPGQSRTSADGRYRLLYQRDGNLVLYGPAGPRWASHTLGRSLGRVLMQTDGNCVLYDGDGKPRWATGTVGHPGARLLVQNDGNVVVYSASGKALWASGTVETKR